jgi:hypothetical protein
VLKTQYNNQQWETEMLNILGKTKIDVAQKGKGK